MPRKPVEQRFWKKVSFGFGPNACWLWTASLTRAGYGAFRVEEGKMIHAHRYVLLLLGRLDEATHHLCANKECVNPAHLVPMKHGEHRKLHMQVQSRGDRGRLLPGRLLPHG